MKNILVTGCAGFIGYHLCHKLLKNNISVVGIDNLNDYYDVNLKKNRLALLDGYSNFTFKCLDLFDNEALSTLFEENNFECVINLAAQAGVRYSLEKPRSYITSNIVGFFNILELSKDFSIKHLIYASSSSVYGLNTTIPFSTNDSVDHPANIYAATKKSNELMAHSYSHLYNLPTTGLRFFTVYGPWGRPDMAMYIFTKAIFEGAPIQLFNYGDMKRDFTYIEDIVESVFLLIDKIPKDNNFLHTAAPFSVYNIGNNTPVDLDYFVSVLEKKIGMKSNKIYLPMQKGDIKETYSDSGPLFKMIGYRPSISIEEGVSFFVDWYKSYYL